MSSVANRKGPQLYLRCEFCGGYFKYRGGKRKRWCSDAHKQAAWRIANESSSASIGSIVVNEISALQSNSAMMIGGGPENMQAVQINNLRSLS